MSVATRNAKPHQPLNASSAFWRGILRMYAVNGFGADAIFRQCSARVSTVLVREKTMARVTFLSSKMCRANGAVVAAPRNMTFIDRSVDGRSLWGVTHPKPK